MISIDVEIKLEENTMNFDSFAEISFENNDENARKLDVLMTLMFQYLEFWLQNREKSLVKTLIENNPFLKEQFEEEKTIEKEEISQILLQIFQEKLLIIYQSKYVQFLLFYLCSFYEKTPEFLEEFLSILITNCLSNNKAKIIKINSLSYLSSFLARAQFISQEILCKSLGFLLDFLEDFSFEDQKTLEFEKSKVLKSQKNSIINQPFVANLDFLMVLQAILYILCYQNSLFHDQKLLERLAVFLKKGMEIDGLEHISIDIVSEFQTLCRKNAKKELLELFKENKQEKNLKIELFFPFDPYLLKRSEVFIRDIYRFWNDESPEEEKEKETDSSSPFLNGEGNDKKRKMNHFEEKTINLKKLKN